MKQVTALAGALRPQDYEIITLTDTSNPHHADILRDIHSGILKKAFGDELDSEGKMLRGLQGDVPVPGMRMAFTIAGKNLSQPGERKVYGASVAYYHAQGDVGYLVYNTREKPEDLKDVGKEALQGMGLEMVARRKAALEAFAAANGRELNFMPFDIHDPAKPHPNDVMDPQKREDHFLKMGAEIVPCGLLLPSVSADGLPPISSNKLLHWPINGRKATPEMVKDLLTGVWGEVTKGHPEHSKGYRQAVELVDRSWQNPLALPRAPRAPARVLAA